MDEKKSKPKLHFYNISKQQCKRMILLFYTFAIFFSIQKKEKKIYEFACSGCHIYIELVEWVAFSLNFNGK